MAVFLSFVLLYFHKSLICIGWDTFCFVCKNSNGCDKDYESSAVCRDKPSETTIVSVMGAGLHR